MRYVVTAAAVTVPEPDEGDERRIAIEMQTTDGTSIDLRIDGGLAAGLGMLLVEQVQPKVQA